MTNVINIKGAKGGGSTKPRTPIESPDSLVSIASARVLDLLSEGPIRGFVHGPSGILRDVFLDETPIANADGTLNFKNVQVDSRLGIQTQDYMPGFPSVENEIAINVELKQDTPWVRAINNSQLNAIRVLIGINALSNQDMDTGDIKGYRIDYAIDIKVGAGAYVQVLTATFNGKTTTKYQRSHRIDLPTGTSWTVRVRRLTADTTASNVQDTSMIDSYTEIIDARMRYPLSALAGVIIDASQFRSIPTRGYYIYGREIRIPSNYNPTTRAYNGLWDGTFQTAWTDNPAWIFYDMVTHPRYGLGHLVSDAQVDKWSLYQIGQHCDQLVPDGKGGTEPRFAASLYLQRQEEAYKVVSDMASIFRGISYWAGGAIVPVADRPEDPVYVYHNANVIDGKFVYQGSGRRARHTVALVSWSDHEDFGRTKVEYVSDEEGIARYGVQQTEVMAIGCSSQGTARRLGNWILMSERLETDVVNFEVGLDGTLAAPGQIIRIADRHRAGRRIGGRITSATSTAIYVDSWPVVAPVAGDTIIIVLPTGVSEDRTVSTVDAGTKRINVSVGFTAVPVAQSAWAIETLVLKTQLFRVISVSESKDSDSLKFSINCLQHEAQKFDAIELGLRIEPRPISIISPNTQPAPTGLAITYYERAGQVNASTVVEGSWLPALNAVAYEVQWRVNNADWTPPQKVTGLLATFDDAWAGTYQFKVSAVGVLLRSTPALSPVLVVPDQTTLPGFVVNIDNNINQEIIDRINAVSQLRFDTEAMVDELEASIGEARLSQIWDATKPYLVGSIVRHSTSPGVWYLYRAKQDTPAGTAVSNATYWDLIGNYTSVGDATRGTVVRVNLHDAKFTDIDGILSAHATDINSVELELVNKASVSALNAIDLRVDEAEGDLVAQGSLISQVTTRVGNVESVNAGQATSINNLWTRVEQVDDRVDVAAYDITIVKAELPNKASVTVTQALEARATNLEQGGKAAGNMLANAGFANDLTPWFVAYNSNNLPWITVRNLAGDAWRPSGMSVMGSHCPGVPAAGNYLLSTSPWIPANEYLSYIVSGYFAAHRCHAGIGIVFGDVNKNNLGNPTSIGARNTGGQSLSGWDRLYLARVAPAGTRYVAFQFWTLTIGSNDPYAWLCRPMLEQVTAGQVYPSPWAAGGAEFSASYTLQLDVNGYVSGFGSYNNGITSQFAVLADKFMIVSPAGGARTEYSSGNWRVYDANGVLRVRLGVW